ncbi:MAG TPA: helix-turn-helix domain-containing protein [Kofleriaceae bacterium]|nr:helix-turn-helix domain-containing protein [Kofleriaceae bacterium]
MGLSRGAEVDPPRARAAGAGPLPAAPPPPPAVRDRRDRGAWVLGGVRGVGAPVPRRAQGAGRWLAIVRTRDSLAAIAAATGFADQAHMTRSVRALTGASPSAWRRDLRAQALCRARPAARDPGGGRDGAQGM